MAVPQIVELLFGEDRSHGGERIGNQPCGSLNHAHAPVRQRRAGSGVDRMTEPLSADYLCNADFELAVSSQTGRIVRYGRIGGPNVLWTNPRPQEAKTPFKGWLNWGGDKVWIWPEEDWKVWTGIKQPPGDPATGPYTVEVHGRHMRMVSPVIAEYGVRIVREITLAPSGPRVTLENRIEKVAPCRFDLPVAPWMVTQLPAPRHIYARISSGATGTGYQNFPPNPWDGVQSIGRVRVMERPRSPWVKIGLDADILAVPVGQDLFISRVVVPASGVYEPHRRAQVFSDPDNSDFRPKGIGPYIEFEFTAPDTRLKPGETNSMTVIWDFVHPRDIPALLESL